MRAEKIEHSAVKNKRGIVHLFPIMDDILVNYILERRLAQKPGRDLIQRVNKLERRRVETEEDPEDRGDNDDAEGRRSQLSPFLKKIKIKVLASD